MPSDFGGLHHQHRPSHGLRGRPSNYRREYLRRTAPVPLPDVVVKLEVTSRTLPARVEIGRPDPSIGPMWNGRLTPSAVGISD